MSKPGRLIALAIRIGNPICQSRYQTMRKSVSGAVHHFRVEKIARLNEFPTLYYTLERYQTFCRKTYLLFAIISRGNENWRRIYSTAVLDIVASSGLNLEHIIISYTKNHLKLILPMINDARPRKLNRKSEHDQTDVDFMVRTDPPPYPYWTPAVNCQPCFWWGNS